MIPKDSGLFLDSVEPAPVVVRTSPVGTVDLGLDAEALAEGEHAELVEALQAHGYRQCDGLRRFQLARTIQSADGGPVIEIIVDFLMPRDAEIVRNRPPLIGNFAVQRADGADLATTFYEMVAIEGPMLEGGTNRLEVAVCSIPALLAMKGNALAKRYKQRIALGATPLQRSAWAA